jgi:hypothetical protein
METDEELSNVQPSALFVIIRGIRVFPFIRVHPWFEIHMCVIPNAANYVQHLPKSVL